MADSPFEDLVVRYQHVVCAVAYAVLRDRARSEEVAQDAFLIAWQKLPSMSPPPAMPGWLCGIARNLAANALRRRKATAVMPPGTPPTPLHELLDRETEALAARALEELPPTYREVVVLYYRGEQSLGEVASALGISESNAKQRLHRGRERLKQALAAVESTLRATRPGPAFTVACVAALAAGGASAQAATLATTKASSPLVIAVPVVVALVLVGALAIRTAVEPAVPTQPPIATLARVPNAATSAPASEPRATPPGNAIPLRRIDETTRAALATRIATARRARMAGTPPPAPSPSPSFAGPTSDTTAVSGSLTKDDIRQAVRTVLPLLTECYSNALPRLSNPAGKLVVSMRFIGEPEIGTVVEADKVEGSDHFTSDPELVECLRETLMSIELPPLEIGGEETATYPFEFSNDP